MQVTAKSAVKSAALALVFGFALCNGAMAGQRSTIPLNAYGKPIAPVLVAPPEQPDNRATTVRPGDSFDPQPASGPSLSSVTVEPTLIESACLKF